MLNSILKGEYGVATIRLLRSGQLTLPSKIRRTLGLEEGAFLDADVEDNRIILTPKKLVEKDKAKERLFSMVEKVWERNKDIPAEEVEKEIAEAIKAVRRRKRK